MKNLKNILCYGDSNTWGFVPGSFDKETDMVARFEHKQRWTGRLQALTSNSCRIFEEGLSGRTLNADDPEMVLRNGLAALQMILDTHEPLHLIILFLGANDCKNSLNRTADQLCEGMNQLIELILHCVAGPDLNSAPQLMLVTYPLPTHEKGFEGEFAGATKKIYQLNQHIRQIAKEKKLLLFDAQKDITMDNSDGIHFALDAHAQFATLLHQRLLEQNFISR